ncbi:hypothetical protein ACWDBP_00235 [Streptomyces sp. NPDC001233]
MNRHTARRNGEMSMRRSLDDGGVEPEGGEPYDEVADPLTGTVRVCARRCGKYISHPGYLMNLQSGRVADMVIQARQGEGHVVGHKTL